MASSGVSFGFSKKLSNFKLIDSQLREESTKDVVEKTDFVINVSDKGIESTIKKEVKTELIIPLITKNNWRFASTKVGSNVNKTETADSLESQAAKEIVADTKRLDDSEIDPEAIKKDSTMTIPLFMQNQVPSGFETDEKMDVTLRPEQASLDDYERVPIEEYGLAMLRGMGWKSNEGIGTTNKRVVKPVEPVLRPKGLGLGADRKAVKKNVTRDEKDEIKEMGVGVFVFIETGPHRTLYGQVEGLDMENGRVMVKLAISSKMVTVSEHIVRIVTDKEYKQEGKLINKEKYEVYKAKSEKELEKIKDREASKRELEEKEDRKTSKKQKHSSKKYQSHDEDRRESEPWVHTALRVRFIDKSYKNGLYYNTKVVIEDVVSRGVCVCKTDDGRLLEDIRESWLETLIPRSDPMIVMVVRGPYKGQLAEIISKNKEKNQVHVQLVRERETILKLDFDSICEYAVKNADFS